MSHQADYAAIRAGFDRAAERYLQEVETNPAMCYLRRVSLDTLDATFQAGQHVIELGCGSGKEAVHLAQRGVHVLATDLSSEMLALTAQRACQAGVQELVHTRQLAAGELADLQSEPDPYGERSFDGAYSSFGPLNGEPDLRRVSAALAVYIRPGGPLVASVMNRFYPLETLWYLAHARPRDAVRRWSGNTMARVSPSLPDVIPTWYYTPRAFARAFAPDFRRTECWALPLLLPPPPLASLWERHPRLVEKLASFEKRLAGHWPLGSLGDHFIMVLHRA